MKQQWTRDELAEHWTLAPAEVALLAHKVGATRLGFAVLLKAFLLEGRFPRQKHEVPGVVVAHLAKQVDVPAELYPRYDWAGRVLVYLSRFRGRPICHRLRPLGSINALSSVVPAPLACTGEVGARAARTRLGVVRDA